MNYKSKRAKATDIPKNVKETVYTRDKGKCVVCGKAGIPNAHVVRRSQGGLGIEQNIVTLCPRCHEEFDNGSQRQEIDKLLREYLQSIYKNWNEEDLIYNKWKNFRYR